MAGADRGEKMGVEIGYIREFLGGKQAILKRYGENTC